MRLSQFQAYNRPASGTGKSGELIATQPGYYVAVAERLLEHLSRRTQAHISRVVPQLVVDRLQAIQVSKDHRAFCALPPGQLQTLFGAFKETTPIEHSGKHIRHGYMVLLSYLFLRAVYLTGQFIGHGLGSFYGGLHLFFQHHLGHQVAHGGTREFRDVPKNVLADF